MNISKLLNTVDQSIPIQDRIFAIPVVHGSLEFTLLLKKHFFDVPPDIVALELPYYLTSHIEKILPFLNSYPIIEIDSNIKSYLVFEPLEPIVEALRNAFEMQIPFYCIDNPLIPTNLSLLYRNWDTFPDTYTLHYILLKDLWNSYVTNSKWEKNPIDQYREIYMSLQLKELLEQSDGNKQILFICGFKHLKHIKEYLSFSKKELTSLLIQQKNHIIKDWEENNSFDVHIYSLSESSPEILSQPGYYNNSWIQFRNDPKSWKFFDRVQLQRNVYKITRNEYEKQSGEIIPPQKEKYFFQFTRNLSLIYNKLLPNPLILVYAAKGFINDNFAKIFYEKLMSIQKASSPFEELSLSLEELGLDSTLIRFRTKLYKQQTKMIREMKSTLQKENSTLWRELWSEHGMCSYPPEDLIIEEYGNYLRKKALSLVKSLETRTFPFTSSLLDGIDYRETIRNYYKNTIFVKESQKLNWNAGNVVVIFSNDEEKFSWKSVWWGEHQEEGDMAFYATPPENHIIGPGIARCLYGGFLLSHPPGRLSYIWSDFEFRNFRTSREKLLAAAIIYNLKNIVVYAANQPPSHKMNYFASRFGQKIIFIPISTLNQKKLGRIRRFHVLSDKSKREDADKYIW